MSERRGASFWIPVCALAVVIGLLVIAPLVSLGEFLPERTDAVSPSRDFSELLVTTLGVSLGVTALSVVLGAVFGLGLSAVPKPARILLMYLSLTTFFVPAYVYAVAWIDLTGTEGWVTATLSALHLPALRASDLFSVWGCVLVLTLSHYPVVMFAAYSACTRIDAEKIDAARTEGSVWLVMRHVLLPHALPFIATGGLVIFLLTLTTYALPSLFQVPVISVEVFTLYNAFHDPYSGLRQSVPVVVIALIALAVWWKFVGTRISHTAFERVRDIDVRPGRLGRGLICFGLAGFVGVSVGLPIAVLVAGSDFPSGLVSAWETTQSEWVTSLTLAAVVTVIVMGISGAGVSLCEHLPRGVVLAMVGLLTVPFLLTGPAWGIALIGFWNQAGWRSVIYDHAAIAVVACTGKYLFVGWLGFSFAVRSVRREYSDAARVFGLSHWRAFFSITLPLIAPYCAVIGAMVFLLVLGEVDSLLLVSPPGFTTVPVRVYGLMHYGPSSLVSAMTVLMVLVIGGVGLVSVLIREWVAHQIRIDR